MGNQDHEREHSTLKLISVVNLKGKVEKAVSRVWKKGQP